MSSYRSYGILILMMAMMNGMRKSGVLTLMLETVLILMMASMNEVKMYQARMN